MTENLITPTQTAEVLHSLDKKQLVTLLQQRINVFIKFPGLEFTHPFYFKAVIREINAIEEEIRHMHQ